MSTVLHGISISKDEFPAFFDRAREHYLTESSHARLIREMEDASFEANRALFDFINEWSDSRKTEHVVALQLFDFGDHYIVRPLEKGWEFVNKHGPAYFDGFNLERIDYDGRTDIPDDQRKWEEPIDRMDEMIKRKQYFIAYLLDHTDLRHMIWDRAMEMKKKRATNKDS